MRARGVELRARLVLDSAARCYTPARSKSQPRLEVSPVATLTKQVVGKAGITPSYAAGSSGGDNFVPDADTFLHFKNTSGSPITVTVVTPKVAPGGQAIADDTLAIPASTGDKMMGPYEAEYYADPANTVPGNAGITYSANPPTGLTVACIQVPRSG